jgi:hypothetical protein
MAHVVAVHHVIPNQHGHQGLAGLNALKLHTQRVGGTVTQPHHLANGLSQRLGVKCYFVHGVVEQVLAALKAKLLEKNSAILVFENWSVS